jgi:hypothetical protein
MNKIKLLSKLQAFFDSDEAKRKKSASEIAEVLNKLKLKQRHTKKKLLQCTNDEFKKVLLLEIEVMSAQIEKGENFLKELVDE